MPNGPGHSATTPTSPPRDPGAAGRPPPQGPSRRRHGRRAQIGRRRPRHHVARALLDDHLLRDLLADDMGDGLRSGDADLATTWPGRCWTTTSSGTFSPTTWATG